MTLRPEEEIRSKIKSLETEMELLMHKEPRDLETMLKLQATLSTMSGLYWTMYEHLPKVRNFGTGESY